MANKAFADKYKLPIKYEHSLELLVSKAHRIAIITAWSEFGEKKDLLRGKNVIDLRYYLDTK
jgi:UDP-glucose 6-dehydrogenase